MNYNRNEFLKTAAFATIGASLSQSFMACTSSEKELKYGIQLYSVRTDLIENMNNTLEYISNAGYSQVEVFGFKDIKSFWGSKPAIDIKKALDAYQLTSPSGHYFMKNFINDGNIDEWKEAVEAATILGNKYMVIPWLDENHRSEEFYKILVDRINVAAELTKSAGMKLAYHNHEFEFQKASDGKTFYQHLLDGTDKNLVEFEMDMFWVAYSKENPIDWFNRYPGRFTMWHFKDGIVKPDGSKVYTPTGDGEIKFDEFFKHKDQAGLKYVFSEQDECKGSTLKECVEKSISNMKKKKWGNS